MEINTSSIDKYMDNKYMDKSVLLCGSKQDYIVMGTNIDINGKTFDWSVTVDGHGTNVFINIIKETDFVPFMIQNEPILHIIEHFRSLNSTYLDDTQNIFRIKKTSGCTIIVVKIYDDLIEGAIIGDSRCAVFIDEEEVFISTPHNMKNPLEIERLSTRPNVITEYNCSKIIKVIGDTKAILVPSVYTTFEDKTRIGLTQALGHNCITEYAPEKFSFNYNKKQHLRFVSGSDGFWDMHLHKDDITSSTNIIINELMNEILPDIIKDNKDILTLSASELTEKALRRWSQVWDIHMNEINPRDVVRNAYPPNGYDDICVFVWDNRKI